ncbi:MAG TPA: molybdopterin-dependent oxidoreductase [Actinomycetota bacterium]|jgi:DMSO/TMAO reductase YedYZ molybdopterin-dependent catalytic subunit
MACALLVTYAGGVFGAVPYPPAAVSSLIIRATPGDVATRAIEQLGHAAQRTLNLGVHAGALVLGALLGVWIRSAADARRRARRALAAGAGLLAAAAAVSLTAPEGLSAVSVAVLVVAAVTFAALGAGGSLLAAVDPPQGWAGYRPGEDGQEVAGAAPGRPSRRRFLAGTAAVVGGAVLGGGAIWKLVGGPSRQAVRIVPADRPFEPPPPDPSFPPVPGLAQEITPVAEFYNVDIDILKPRVDHMGWQLAVGGLVDRPYRLTFETLQHTFEVVEMAHTLTCVSNEVGGDLISTTIWRGVRLKDVLERAGLRTGVEDVVFRAVDNYSDSIPLAKALEDRTLVVFGMDGAALPREHGFPARIIVPGIYGMKNVKWVTSIEAVSRDYQGYWQERGWSDVARIKTESRIDVPADGSIVAEGTKVAGVAWAGDRGVSAVEISEDGGVTWRPATLERELSPVAWRRWFATLSPGTGSRRVLVRATDGNGNVQTAEQSRPHPDGASGYHEVAFDVRA